jgi:hypothetical protein
MNDMYWKDGSQDANQIPGIQSILLESPTSTVGSIDQAANVWWKSRASLALGFSAENQTLTKFFRREAIQLKRYGGRPNKAFCGADFIQALFDEVEKKGTYTQTGFASGKTDITIDGVQIKGIGTFEYDPSLDTLGLSKDCFVMDSRRLKSRPMEGEKNKTFKPARPYQYMIMLKSMTNTGALTCTQMNANGRYRLA